MIRAANIEIGDFAANSVLIQDAKSFALLKGNYSRVGFNHPGPAILYVLMFGEVLFHDWLHVVQSPFSGQLIAVALYNACWIALMARLFVLATGDRWAALLGIVVFCFVATLIDHDVAGGAWFPHLYFFPFAAFLVAAARTVGGHADGLLTLATSAGFLVNGHVSFGFIVTVIVVVVVAVNFVRFRRGEPERRIFGATYWRLHARRLVATFGVFGLFLVPLLVETVRAWPGPIAAYLGYGSGQPPQPLAEVLVFVGVYWGGLAGAAGAVATMIYLQCDDRASPTHSAHVRSIGTVALAASVAMFAYGRYGVDDLKYRYVGLFYYAVPAMIVAITAIAVVSVPQVRVRKSLAIALAVAACVAGFYTEISRRPFYAEQYNEPDAVTLYRSLESAASGHRILLDLDTRGGFDYLWTRLVGAEAYAKRRGEIPFCIRKNWHVLFTDAVRCTATETATASRYAVRTTAAPVSGPAPPEFSSVGLNFFRLTLPDISGAQRLTLAENGGLFADYLLDDGWSSGEGDHAWTIASKAQITVPLHAGFRGAVTLDLDSFLPRPDSRQAVVLRVNGGSPQSVVFTPANRRQSITVAMVLPAGSTAGVIDFRIVAPVSPTSAGTGVDPRPLGVALHALAIRQD